MASCTGGNSGCLFLTFGRTGLCRANGISLLGKILTSITYKNLIYLLNFLFHELAGWGAPSPRW